MANIEISVAQDHMAAIEAVAADAVPIETVAAEAVQQPELVAIDAPLDLDALRHDAAVTGPIQAATSGVIRDMNIEAAPIYDMQNFGRLIEGMVIWDEATELPTQPAVEHDPTPSSEAGSTIHETGHD